MSTRHRHPRQDRRGLGRSVVRDHAGVESFGTSKPKTILDRENGRDFDGGAGPAAGTAPGANGPAETEARSR